MRRPFGDRKIIKSFVKDDIASTTHMMTVGIIIENVA
jgi:hypothetical protein